MFLFVDCWHKFKYVVEETQKSVSISVQDRRKHCRKENCRGKRFLKHSNRIRLMHYLGSDNGSISSRKVASAGLEEGINLFPRLSLLWLLWSLEERPQLRLVTWPPRICWVEGVAECFVCFFDKSCKFQNLDQYLKITRSIGVWSRILPMKNVTLFLKSLKYTRVSFASRNSAAEWSTNYLTVGYLNSEVIYFHIRAVLLKSISVTCTAD